MARKNLLRKTSVSFSAKTHGKNGLGRWRKGRLVLEQLECRMTPAAFTPGDIVIYRVGTGTILPTDTSTAVFLDEYTLTGQLVQSVALPTSGSNPLSASSSATSEGLLTLSANGKYLVVPGYDAAPGIAGVSITSTTAASPVLREVDLVDSSGAVASSTTTRSFSGSSMRGAGSTGTPNPVTNAGPQIWMTGGASGLITNTAGASGRGTVVSSTPTLDLRGVDIFGGQLFVSSASGSLRLAFFADALPTNTGYQQLELSGMVANVNSSSPYSFAFANLGSGNNFESTGMDTLFVADNTSGIQKWFYKNGAWSPTGTVLRSGDLDQGLAVIANSPTNVVVFATTNAGNLESLTDASGAGGTLAATPQVIASAPTNTYFRGVVLSPDDGPGSLGRFGYTAPCTVNAGAAPINSSATFSDLSAFNGGSLTVHLASGGTTNDTLTVGALGAIIVAGGSVFDGGTQIGTVSGGANGSDLVIAFDSVVNTFGSGGTQFTVTSAQVQDLLRAISFASSGAAGSRSVQFTVVKNGSIDSASATQTVSVTLTAVPTLDNPSATAVTTGAATLKATLENIGGLNVTDFGFFYEAGTSIDAGATKVDLGPGSPGTPPVSFVTTLGSLTPQTTYTFQGYGTNAGGTGFTAPTSFTTQGPPTVTTPTSTAIHAASATLGGTITSANGAPISDYGIVYSSTNSSPVIGGPGVTQLSLGAGVPGAFHTLVTELNAGTSYHFAAYATNSFGTMYSAVGPFTTLASPTVAEKTLAAATYGTFAITTAALKVTDPDPEGTDTYTAIALPSGGMLKLNGNPLPVNGTFTQADIDNSLVSYSAGGSGINDSFTFILDNGVGGTLGSTIFHIHTIAPQTFHAGNLLVYRIGDGFKPIATSGAEVFLDEYTSAGTLVQSIPVSDSGSAPLIAGSDTDGGMITFAASGNTLLLTGYRASLGTQFPFISNTTSSVVPRAVGVVSPNGAMDLSTTTTQFSQGGLCSATADGSTIWIVGHNSGVITQQQGGSGAGTVINSSFARVIQIFGGQLYFSGGGIFSVGSGEPTSANTPATMLPGVTPGYTTGFFFARLGSGASFNGFDTLYVANEMIGVGGTVGGIEKWSYNGTTWVRVGIAAAAGVRGLTGVVSNGSVTLYGATGSPNPGTLYLFTDSAGAGGAISGTATVLATVATNEDFRGVALVPIFPNQAPAITSANNTAFTVGAASAFKVTVTGYPVPTIGASGALPSGVTFVNGMLTGTPALGTIGTYNLILTATNGVGADATQPFTLTINQPVAVQNVQIDDGSAQRSMIKSITINFSGAVGTVDAGAFQVIVQNGANPTVGVSWNASRTTATLTFSGPLIIGGSLQEGNFNLVIDSTKVHDTGSGLLDGDGNGLSGGARAADAFFRLFGDSDGDRDVDNLDLFRFRQSFGLTNSDAGYKAYFDFDSDGDVDSLDLFHFRQRFGTSL
jgi:hypothetical protein